MMCGWISLPTSEASFRNTLRKRRRRSVSTPPASLTSLMATSRSANGSRPRKTRLVAPWPISRTTGYLPIFAGTSLMASAHRHLHAALHGRACSDPVEPALDAGKVGEVHLVPFVPRHPRVSGDVRHRVLRAEPFTLREVPVEHGVKPAGLLAVALDRVGHRLGRRAHEMVHLAEHRPDAT